MARSNFEVVKGETMGAYTVVAANDTANTVTIPTGKWFGKGETAVGFVVTIMRSGKQVSSDPAISLSSNNLVVADGSTYVLTTGDVINYIVY